MMISVVFILTVLAALPVWAEVVDDFNECSQFFYKDTEPQGMDQNVWKICQKYENKYFYASLYSTFHRIPLYSAYTFESFCESQEGETSSDWWFSESQFSGLPEDSMQQETNDNHNVVELNQAINGDYSNTGYDRGHLNPNSFQCGKGRVATFTLTNSAPMDACFNRVHWYQWEKNVMDILKQYANRGTAYLVIGTVPSEDDRIPRQEEYDDSSTGEFNRVTVPTHVWTAVCYKDNINEESFSFGYIGLNQPDSRINVMTVPQLNYELTKIYGAQNVKIFKDDCFSTNSKRKSEEIVKTLFKMIQQPFSDSLTMSDDILNTFHTSMTHFDDEDQPPSKKPKITQMTIHETFNSLDNWFEKTERMKYVSGSTCVLSKPFTGSINSLSHTELKNRDTTANSQELVCTLVPEQVSDCTTSCLYKEEARGYYCYYGTEERSCSPKYSIITVSGTTCNSDHTCGTHGYNYYWCWVGEKSWDYCSPPLPQGKGKRGKYCRPDHNCGRYGEDKTWCYTDYKGNRDYCCGIAEDRFSALNGKTCKSDHPCDYHSYSYLWCYTTDGSWEYCCSR